MKSEQESGKQGRRQHERAFKEELVRQSLEPGASVSAIALRHGVNANMLFRWRRLHGQVDARRAAPTVLLPVEVAPPSEVVAMPESIVSTRPAAKPAPRNGVIELEVAGVQLRVRGAVDEASLCSVLRALCQAQ